jgi:hypothetical protein
LLNREAPNTKFDKRILAMRLITIFALTATCLVSACGNEESGTSTKSASGHKPPSDWNATDACSVLDKAVYGSLTEKRIASTSLALSWQSDGTTAATSECTYVTNEDERFRVMLRWSPINDNTEGAINETRSGLSLTVKAFNGELETLNGLGKAAFWVDLTKSLNVFIGEDKMAIINVPAGPKAKEQAIAIARKLGA